MNRTRTVLLTILALIAIVMGAVTSFRLATRPPQLAVATLLPAPIELPEFSLIGQDGQPVGRDVFEGQWDLLFFGFTRCPDVCPLTLQVLANARRQLEDQGIRPLPRIVLVSVDPERDTPELLQQYLGYFGTGNLGITGDLAELHKLTDKLGIYFEKSQQDGDNYSVDHSAVVLLVDPQGRFRALFGSPHEAKNFVHDLPVLMAER